MQQSTYFKCLPPLTHVVSATLPGEKYSHPNLRVHTAIYPIKKVTRRNNRNRRETATRQGDRVGPDPTRSPPSRAESSRTAPRRPSRQGGAGGGGKEGVGDWWRWLGRSGGRRQEAGRGRNAMVSSSNLAAKRYDTR